MVWRWGRAAVALAATAWMLGCKSGVLDKTSGTIALDGGRVGTADSSVIGPGGSVDSNTPRLLSCDALLPDAPDWAAMTAPASLEGLVIKDAWAAARDDLYFVGMRPVPGNDVLSDAQIVRWARGCWSLELSWQIPSALMVSISGSAPGDVWAAMGNALFRRDGTGWMRADAELQALLDAQHPGYTASPAGVRVAGSAVWVIGRNSFIWRRDANGWRMFELTDADVFGADDPQGSRGSFWFTSLWAGGRDDVAIGGAIHLLGRIPDSAFVYRYDGATWARWMVSDGAVSALWGDGAGGLWIAAPNGHMNPPLFHDDATLATVSPVSPVWIEGWPAMNEAASLWGPAPDDLLVAGGGSLARWDGAGWTMNAAPPTTAVDDTAVIAGAEGATWIARRGPRFFRRDPGPN